MTAADVAMT